MADQRLILDSAEAVELAAKLCGALKPVYANGTLPEGLAGSDHVIIFGRAREWVDRIDALQRASGSPIVRPGVGDFLEIDQKQPFGWLRDRVAKIPSSPPSEQAAQVPPLPAGVPTQNGGEPLGSDLSDFDLRAPTDMDEAAENALRSIRQTAALKKHAFQDATALPAGEWPDPADFWGVTALPEFLPQYLPPAIEPYVTDQASRAGIDPAQVALNCYVICAALIRGGIELQMQEETGDGRTWREKPILWGAVVGDPSSGKGPGLDIALHKFFKIASALRLKDEEAWQRYDEDIKIHEKRMQQFINDSVKPGANPGRPIAPEKPPRERLWTDDVTKEVVAKLLTENPRGKIAILKDELASWFGGFDAYGNGKSDKDRPDWISFYESKERYIDRAMEGRSYHVPSWGGIILGGIQPEVLSRIQGKLGADGMLQRFQIIVSRSKRQVPKRASDAEAVKDWNRLLENLAALQPGAHPIILSAEAAAYMDEQVAWIGESMQAGLIPELTAALGKWEGLFGRLMITSHCIECAAQGLGHPSALVSLRTAEQAWGWMRWILWPHAVRFYMGEAGDEFSMGRGFAEFVLGREITRIKPHVLNSIWSRYRKNLITIQMRREFWVRLEQCGWVRPFGAIDRNSLIAQEYEVNTRAFDGRFSEQAKSAANSVLRYRQAMHPAMLAKQGREPGED